MKEMKKLFKLHKNEIIVKIEDFYLNGNFNEAENECLKNFTDNKIINKEGQRIPEVFVKHKILDAIGDLFLLGMPIIGHFVAYKSGHRLNNLLLRELMSNKDSWEIVTCINKEEARKRYSFKIPSFRTLDAVQA
jgi:UDP-3-O-acyl-N-acetylglucosamine deacetylase